MDFRVNSCGKQEYVVGSVCRLVFYGVEWFEEAPKDDDEKGLIIIAIVA